MSTSSPLSPTPNRADAVAALVDPQRRDLYRLAADHAVTRDDAAATLGLPRSTAALNLDRLVDAGLLTVSYERRSGRTGPGAGRPAKLYRATADELSATIPERHYELVGDLLAAAVEHADETGTPVREALAAAAFAAGASIGAGAEALEGALTACGYAPNPPRRQDAASPDLVLENCPFHVLASRHTALICGANLEFVRGLAAATDDERTPVLAPADGRCCVEIRACAP
ncbi:helix-turn-helix transcriptional regulator [Microbacterium kyungheense]|uniref:Putative ArsR family transcriptional regulator n=1 Tax=Microbacterium kyungheense TaxID=1263636 RepID=A0A543F0Z4_9MICO|nr:helix-turn-helix domain-containing protein [Microbacterium kyungheense]TQM27497.1 putative ArsR family transcriptional regulator [Microbacterium kyungheense]